MSNVTTLPKLSAAMAAHFNKMQEIDGELSKLNATVKLLKDERDRHKEKITHVFDEQALDGVMRLNSRTLVRRYKISQPEKVIPAFSYYRWQAMTD